MYGPQHATGPSDPYEMLVYLNCGYPASDTACSKGFEALKREVGLTPKEILAAAKSKLVKLLRLGGIVPELRADRLKEVARKVKAEFGGDLKSALQNSMRQEKKQTDKGIRGAKKFPSLASLALRKFCCFRSWRQWRPCRPQMSKCLPACGSAKPERITPRTTARRAKS